MSIKKSLSLIIGVLGLFIIILSGNNAYEAFEKRSQYTLSAKMNLAIGELLMLGSIWAQERGVTNSMLNDPNKITAEKYKLIVDLRNQSDQLKEKVIHFLSDVKII